MTANIQEFSELWFMQSVFYYEIIALNLKKYIIINNISISFIFLKEYIFYVNFLGYYVLTF